jgi:hypothetical protein
MKSNKDKLLDKRSLTLVRKVLPVLLFILLFPGLLLSLCQSALAAQTIKLAWDAPDPLPSDFAGYKVYYGLSSRTGDDPKSCGMCGYTTKIGLIGNPTSYNLNIPNPENKHFISVTAYDNSNNESVFSNEVAKEPAPSDFDGDGATDVAAFHLPSDQFFSDSAGNLGQYGWGGSDSYPLVWDYDGDGKVDMSFYHILTNQWFVKGVPGDNLGQFGWGGEDSVPVPGDYDGDGMMERAFYHSPTNRWFVEFPDAVEFFEIGWNGTECIPVPGDYDGDGITDMVIYHIPTNQWFQYGIGNLGQFGWGGVDSIPVPGDYNGDGKTEIAIYHVPTNQWFVKGIGNLGQYGWGGLQSFPIPGDYDGDGTWERGFYRPSQNRWFIEGEADFVWGWGGSEFMPITSQMAIFNWFRFVMGRFQ